MLRVTAYTGHAFSYRFFNPKNHNMPQHERMVEPDTLDLAAVQMAFWLLL